MRGTSSFLSLAAVAILAAPAAASADFQHTVGSGESLTSVAAADGLSVAQLAAANGLSPDAQLVAGTSLAIPPQSGASGVVSAPASTESSGTVGDGDGDADDVGGGSSVAASGTAGYVVQPGDTLSSIAARQGISVASLAAANGLDPNGILVSGTVLGGSGSGSRSGSSASSSSGVASPATAAYVVQPGDTLTGIAAREGVSVAQLAASNGLDPNGVLVSGTVLGGSGSGGSADAATSQPVGTAAEGSAGGPPYPTPERVSSSQVGAIASANGVSPSLADAIGWQESGFNNDLVSSAGARGVMQILPGTWDWIQRTMTAGTPLAPASAADNVRGGVLLLHSLLNSTGGDPAMAAAGYYQGLPSVQAHGMYSDTQAYVNSVMALRQRFGGP
jgi:LysM repeat protein